MAVKAGYRQTEVGVIPEDWEIKKIGEFTNCTSGGTPDTKISRYWGGEIRWMSSGELHLKFVTDVKDRITDEGLKNSSAKLIPKKCILVGLAGQGKTRGTVAINLIELCTNQSIAAILPNSTFKPEYLYYNLDSRYNELRDLSTGSGGRGGLNLSIIRSIPVPLPNKEEQTAIAAALSDADALITVLDRLIAKKQAIKQGAMQELLTGKKRLPGFEGEWETKQLGDIVTFLKGKGLSKADLRPDGDRRCIHYGELFTIYGETIDGVVSGTNNESTFFYSRKNDVLMPTSDVTPSGLATASCIMRSGVILGGDILVMRTSERIINGKFLAYSIRMNRNQILQIVSGTTVVHLYGRDMAKIVFRIPKIEEQIAIAAVLSDMDAEIAALERKRDKALMIKEGMMQELLTGRTRLV